MGANWLFTDLTANPNEREWSAEPALGGGIAVRAYDDAGAEFDSVMLRRYGAFIVLDFSKLAPKLPPSLEFMRPLIESARRMRSVGLPSLTHPVAVHSSYIKRVMELGQAPKLSAYRPHGSLLLFGVKVVWDEALDEYTSVGGG